MTARHIQLERPSLRAGWEIFASRPLSLVAALLLAVVLAVVSFGLLAPPAVAAFYHAVRHSRRERFFIDLESVARTAGLFLRGCRWHFLGGYVVGILGPALAVGLLVTPVLVFEGLEERVSILTVGLQILFLPAFFWAGAVLLHGYPYLVELRAGLRALRYALAAGWRHPLPALTLGFLVLFPVTGAVFHLLMVFSYPILVASAVAATGDGEEWTLPERAGGWGGWAFWSLMMLALAAGGLFGARLAGGVGVVFMVGLWLVFVLLTRMTGLGYGAAIFGFAIGFTAILLGGGTIVARRWGEAAVVPWTAFGIVALVLLLRAKSGAFGRLSAGGDRPGSRAAREGSRDANRRRAP